MKKLIVATGVIGASLLALTAKNSDPTLMTVNGKDVPVSEFEYLYHKNNAQQAMPQTIDQYVGMFINYKLKVADAEAAGLDTTASFRDEFFKFRNELADPYLQDSTVLEALVEEAYAHKGEEVLVSHIMMRNENEQTLDSLRNAIIVGQTTFEDAARNFSTDGYSASRGALMGTVVPGRYPWPFEEMAYNTKVGEISPVVNSGFGLHIIRVESRKPARGEVKAAHILRATRGMNDSLAAIQKQLIDSIYNVAVADPSKFEELAKEFSDDPGSGKRGGDLGWFGPGQMVTEFDSVSFAIPVGTVSEPFRTQFGWHIIMKEDARGIGSLDDNRAEIIKQINSSARGNEPRMAFIREAAKKYNAKLNEQNIASIAPLADNYGTSLDSAMIAQLATNNFEVFSVGKNSTTLADVLANMAPMPVFGGNDIMEFIQKQAEAMMNSQVLDLAREDLYAENADYRNLVNEYRDGILLFDISNQNVWDRAAKDREGLESFFNQNKAKYQWDAPKFKATIIFANNDSTLTQAIDYASSLPADIAPADFVKSLRDKFGREVKVERVIAAKGENAITDYLGFGEEKPASDNTRWKYYAAFGGRVIDAPEEAADVRGAAVADFQEHLENQWVSDLKKKYKVKVNTGVLKKVK